MSIKRGDTVRFTLPAHPLVSVEARVEGVVDAARGHLALSYRQGRRRVRLPRVPYSPTPAPGRWTERPTVT